MKIRLFVFIIKFCLLLLGSRIAYSDVMSLSPSLRLSPISEIIHGEDNRLQTFESVDKEVIKLGEAVAIITNKSKLHHFNSNYYIFSAPSLGEKLNLCEGQRFKEEPTLGHCSGFLVEKDLFVTAGHCITKEANSKDQIERNCKRLRIVFNYNNEELKENSKETGKTKTVKKQNVYRCEKVVGYHYKKTKFQLKDYAVIKLDRPANKVTPLKIRKHGYPNENDKLMTIGHPLGIPQKVSNEARIFPFAKENDENFFSAFIKRRHIFYANLDTFAGNSGSPVINEDTLKVEGIFLGGDEEDFIFEEDSWCRKAKTKPNEKKSVKEYVQRIKLIKKYLK